MTTDSLQPESRVVHASTSTSSVSRPAAVPLYQTSMFTFDELDAFTAAWSGPGSPHAYSRLGNPTTEALESAVADLEGGVAAQATASGMGAISSVLLSLLSTGDHVIVQRGGYGGTVSLFRDLAQRWGIEVTYVPVEEPRAVSAAVRPNSKLLYLETIANPLGEVCDLVNLSNIGREAGLITMVDNTFATPLLCQPLEHGADISVHSATKYIAGHSDVIGGIAVFGDYQLYRTVWERSVEIGATADPFAAWLALRGLQTLPVRMRKHCANAAVLADCLSKHDRVEKVYWPGLTDHPSHKMATDLLADFGGVLAFDVVGGRDSGRRFTERINLAQLAPSLGGVCTTVLHPASTSHCALTPAQLAETGLGAGTIRVAVGLEHQEDLRNDVVQALG